MASQEGYGSIESVPRISSRTLKPRRLVFAAFGLALAACVVIIFQNNIVSLLQDNNFLTRPESYWNLKDEPWEDKWQRWSQRELNLDDDYQNPLTDKASLDDLQPFGASWANLAGKDFKLKTGDWASLEDYRFYSGHGCMTNPFPDLPPGFLCSSPGVGVYLLDEYGNPYPRRIQHKVREHLDQDAKSIEKVVRMAPQAEAHRQRWRSRGRWVNPAGWVAASLLPNETACQDAIEGFYAAISSPANLTDAAAFLSDDFVYRAPAAPGLLPACVADAGAREELAGAEAWTAAMERQAEAFNGSASTLEGNLTCRAVATNDPLAPEMLCVARHGCEYGLKKVKNAAGENQRLQGEVLDRFWFDTRGLIKRYESEADPTVFRAALEPEEEGEEGEEGDDAPAEEA